VVDRSRRRITWALAAVAIVVTAVYLTIFIATAQYTLAFDYLAYDAAARRVVTGGGAYDLALTRPGVFGLFFYPAPFLWLVLPLTVLPAHIAAAFWIVALIACFVVAILLLPVRDEVRWLTMALAGVSWPLIFSVKVGQVAPILVLLFAIGWRWLDRIPVVGVVAAIGTLIKLQPALLFGWLFLERRWKDIAVGLALTVTAAVLITPIVGLHAWSDFIQLMRGLDDPLVQPANYSPGTVAYFLGVGHAAASAIQWLSTLVVLGLVIGLQRWGTRESSFLLAVVATQVASPILWDHYALVLVLPVAWLLERRQWWAVLVPLSQAAPLLLSLPPITWVAGYTACMAGLVIIGVREARAAMPARIAVPSGSSA